MELGDKIKFKSYDVIREGIVLEDLGQKILIVIHQDWRMEGIKLQINKNKIL